MANDSVLTIIKAVASEVGITEPTTATGSTDVQIRQLLALCNKEGKALAARRQWTDLIVEQTFTTLAAADQGKIDGGIVSANAGFKYILNDTIWNRSTRFPGSGPVAASGWQQMQAIPISGFWQQYRIRGGHLLFNPIPVAGQTCAFEYVSENWVSNVAGDATKNAFTADDDYPLLDSDLIQAGLLWRWKSAKGLEYAEDMATYEFLVADAATRDGTTKKASLSGCSEFGIRPVVMVAAGSWPL